MKYPQQEGWILKIIDEENQRMHTVEIDTPRRFVVVIIKEREDPRRNSSVSIRTTDWFDITKDYYTPDENGKIPRIIPHKTITVAGRTAVTTASKDDTYIHSGTRTITFKPAPKGWGKYNVVSTGGNCEDPENETIDTILNSLQFIQ